MIKICILDPYEISRLGLSLLLEQQKDFEVTAIHGCITSLLEQLPSMDCDILLMASLHDDISTKTLLQQIHRRKPLQKIILITLKGNRKYAQQLAGLGQPVYCIEDPVEKLTTLTRHLYKGKKNRTTAVQLTQNKDTYPLSVAESKPRRILTIREIEILRLIYLQYSNSDIARQLYLSTSTVETHRKNIIRKLGAHNTVGIIKYVVQNNLFSEVSEISKLVWRAS